MTPLEILKKKFGYSSFRLEQEDIIQSVLQKKDTFVLMPTGGGKSLCYQIPALIFDGLTLVISPLIALMKDQVDALRVNGIEAAYLNSTQSFAEQEEVLRKARDKSLKLLYLAPERLLRQPQFLKTITSLDISLIAIDEAHCISHWGHDFRPDYRMLAQLKQSVPDAPVIALTATADQLTRKDIIEKLELRNPGVFVASFNRANIRYRVEPKRNQVEKLLMFLSKHEDDAGIIYCLSRASTERLATQLTEEGFPALPYHAGMDKDQRARHQDMFLRDEVRIIVATIAFGMGIDKSNVRFVVHMDLPRNIESYYQETGRAGRDGLDSEALLFFSLSDVVKMKRFVEIEDNPEQTEILLKKLSQMGTYGNLTTCRRKYLLNYFDESAADRCDNCDICLAEQRPAGISTLPPKYETTLFRDLKMVRRELAELESVPAYIILSDATLVELATYLPQTREDFRKISGFSENKIGRYEKYFREAVVDYCVERGLASRIHTKKPRVRIDTGKESDTKQISLSLFNHGYTIAEIAERRGLKRGTIETHLAYYVQQGKLSIDKLVTDEKIQTIQAALEGATSLSATKVKLGEEYSYGEIRMVMAHREFENRMGETEVKVDSVER